MFANDDRRGVPPEEEDWVLDFTMFEDILLSRQVEQDVGRLCSDDVHTCTFLLRQP